MLPLRLTCLLAGFLVLVAPPAMLFPAAGSTSDPIRAAAFLAAVLLSSASFLFIAATAHRLRRSRLLRRLCTCMLAASFLAAVTAFWASTDPASLWTAGLLLAFTLAVALYLCSPSPTRRLRTPDNPVLRPLLTFHQEGQSRIIRQEPTIS